MIAVGCDIRFCGFLKHCRDLQAEGMVYHHEYDALNLH